MSDPQADLCRLYLITPPAFEVATFAPILTSALDAGDVACLQLRLKDADDDQIRRACDALRPIAQDREVAFILNDRPDLAREFDCDGVHVGQDDWPYDKARKEVGDRAIVGVTCHDSRHLAMTAAEKGADYVAFGAFYPTATKQPKAQASVELLQWWSLIAETPSVAIGGITVDNAAPLIAACADFIAVVSGVWDHADGPAAAVRAFNKLIEATPREVPDFDD